MKYWLFKNGIPLLDYEQIPNIWRVVQIHELIINQTFNVLDYYHT